MKSDRAPAGFLVLLALLLAATGAPLRSAQRESRAQPPSEPAHEKIAPVLREILAAARRAPSARDVRRLGGRSLRVDGEGRLQVYVHLERMTQDALEALQSAGARIERTARKRPIAQAWIRLEDLETLAALAAVRKIALPDYAVSRSRRSR